MDWIYHSANEPIHSGRTNTFGWCFHEGATCKDLDPMVAGPVFIV